MSVTSFQMNIAVPAGIRRDGRDNRGFFAGGQFTVRALFNGPDTGRYEYRQLIRGSANTTEGRISQGVWHATGNPTSVAHRFKVPGGLDSTFKEDGELKPGRAEHFGRRRGRQVNEVGLEDRYLPDRLNGNEYRLRDTWGLRGATRPVGLRIQIELFFHAFILDRADGDKVVADRAWRVGLNDVIAG